MGKKRTWRERGGEGKGVLCCELGERREEGIMRSKRVCVAARCVGGVSVVLCMRGDGAWSV